MDQGVDIGLPFENFTNRVLNLFKKQSKLKTVHKRKASSNSKKKVTTQEVDQSKIDSILDKISKSGATTASPKKKKTSFFRLEKRNR